MPAVCLTHAFGLDALMGILLVDFLRYLLPAATLAGLLVLLPADWVASRRVRTLEPAPGQPRREFLFSMSTVLIFSAVGALIIAGVQADVLRIYQDVADHGWPYLIASLAAVTAEALTDGTTEAPGD